jgi:hypothetical protein
VGNDYAPREQVRRKESVVKHGGEDFEDLFLPADKDPFGDIPPAAVKPEKEQARKKEQNYLHVDMDEIAVGVNATSFVWLRLLQLRCMRPKEKYQLLSNKWLERYGVDRKAKARALGALKQRGLIRTARPNAGNTRAAIIPKSQRSVAKTRRLRGKSGTVRRKSGTRTSQKRDRSVANPGTRHG